nr:hypothetical protein [uncultured Draconibacterium sp.]
MNFKTKTMRIAYKLMLLVCGFFLLAEIGLANQVEKTTRFNRNTDLLIMQFDCKTDVDDIHSAAALKMLMTNPRFSTINYYAVAGSYGVQEGLYVPPNELFKMAFGENWADAHSNREKAVEKVKVVVLGYLQKGGNIWIAEAGQSDFSAALIKALQKDAPEINTAKRIHIVQHSDWNEQVTSEESLAFVKVTSNYHKIPDGNAEGNGTPGFRTPGYNSWKTNVKDTELIQIWRKAIEIGLRYNGRDGRYNNEAVASGGLDFSDLSEVCWILGIEDIKDPEEFFSTFGR